jgi:hypothetical protein
MRAAWGNGSLVEAGIRPQNVRKDRSAAAPSVAFRAEHGDLES